MNKGIRFTEGMAKAGIILASIVMIGFIIACAPLTYKSVVNSHYMSDSAKVSKDKAYNVITSVLIDEGFDIKMGNKDIGVITTEWKKYGAVNQRPPFDLFLQLKIKIKDVSGGSKNLQVSITPLSKEVNRLNSAAFTERPLRFFDEELQKGYLVAHDKAMLQGHLIYMNILSKIAEVYGLDVAEVKHTLEMYSSPR